MAKTARGIFVVGTDTDVGKTYVATQILRQLRDAGTQVGAYKPAASGCEKRDGRWWSADAAALWDAAGRPADLAAVCPQCFAAPLAPHLAARAEGRVVDAQQLRAGLQFWLSRCDVLLVEGAGGLLSPISDDDYVADLASDFGFPLVVVAPNRVGVINQTLQTLVTAATFREGLDVAGIVLNDVTPRHDDPSCQSNAAELRRHCVPPLLAELPFGGACAPAVDWAEIAQKPRQNCGF